MAAGNSFLSKGIVTGRYTGTFAIMSDTSTDGFYVYLQHRLVLNRKR